MVTRPPLWIITRHNYAVQKSDKVTVKELMPRLGEYDYLAISGVS
ncbi:MAG: zinc-dependent metalloprotease [Butyricimonas faecalis]